MEAENTLREITCLPVTSNNLIKTFCLNTTDSLEFCLINRTSAEVYQIRFDNADDDNLNIFRSMAIQPCK